MEFRERTIILGVTGGIAIHKSIDLASQLVKSGASVHIVMTANATRLVQPLQFQVISRNPVLLNLFDAGTDWKPPHIDLADRADLLVIAPATANIIGKMANGIADDALSTVAVSVHCPILLAPAMNGHMYHNSFVQRNIDTLKTHGIHFIEPASGDLACGYEGTGRLNTVEAILQGASDILDARSDTAPKVEADDLRGTRVLVTAGATREYIDPVRFITNRSSGKMGYAIAEAAAQRGAEVRLISGTATVPAPIGIEIQHVETTLEMHDAVLQVFNETDIAIMAGAPADYRPSEFTPHKIKKTAETLTLPLERNPDIAQTLGERKKDQTLVCFAAETNDILENAKKKLVRKNCDLIVANDILAEGAGFEVDTNIVNFAGPRRHLRTTPTFLKARRGGCHSDKGRHHTKQPEIDRSGNWVYKVSPYKMNHQQVRDFFALNHTRPKKRLGQNFLVNPEVLGIILEAGEITGTDTVIEIGAGLGCLTDVLARRAKRVIAVEVDELLYKALVAHFGVTWRKGEVTSPLQKSIDSHVQLLNADILKLELNSLLSSDTGTVLYGRGHLAPTVKVIANLPYSITTPILWKLLDHHKQIHSCVLMMQKEVAERIVAGPGGKDYGALTIGVAYYAEATLIATLSPDNFYPAPKVDSALLKLEMRETPKVAVENEELFFKVVRTAFRMRRKMLKNALVRGKFTSAEVLASAFEELGIAPERRAETLDITEFAALANFLSAPTSLET